MIKGWLLLPDRLELDIILPNQLCKRNPQFHHRKSTISPETHRRHDFPIQSRLPYENGIQAFLTQVSSPRSDSIHRSGMKEFGFEKYASLCNIAQVGQLTTVYGQKGGEGGIWRYVALNEVSGDGHSLRGSHTRKAICCNGTNSKISN